jgi:hypothetical protein
MRGKVARTALHRKLDDRTKAGLGYASILLLGL